jgi:uncharacterized protein (DUF488 family)
MNRAGEKFFTIGHSTRKLDDFTGILRRVGITLVVDVRAFPRSRTAPQFNIDTLPGALAREGVAYRHLPALGGRRHHAKGEPPSVNGYWRVPGFRNYADHARTEEFRTGLESLLALAPEDTCAIMCAEAVWWRCHRRIIADYLLAAGTPVAHVMGSGGVVPATLTPGAIIMDDGTLRYPATPDAIGATSLPGVAVAGEPPRLPGGRQHG